MARTYLILNIMDEYIIPDISKIIKTYICNNNISDKIIEEKKIFNRTYLKVLFQVCNEYNHSIIFGLKLLKKKYILNDFHYELKKRLKERDDYSNNIYRQYTIEHHFRNKIKKVINHNLNIK